MCLELKVLMLNINPGYNEMLMKECKTLRDYMAYVEKVRIYTKKMGLEDAVDCAIEECIQAGILAKFLSSNRAEVKSVSIFEYDEEQHMRQVKEEGKEEGRDAGIALCGRIFKVLQEHADLTDQRLSEECGASIEEVKRVRKSLGL